MPYRWLDHTAELELHVTAPTEAGVFEEALRAFAELIGDQPEGEPASFEVDIEAPDRPGLLARWLDELVFRAETDDLVPEAIERLELGPGSLAATVRGRRDEPRHVVKGVTLHRLAFERAGDGYCASVVLDV